MRELWSIHIGTKMKLALVLIPVQAAILFFSLSSSSFVISPTTNARDQHALLAIKAQINSDPDGHLSSWSDTLHFCNWKGVSCGHHSRQVIGLELSSMSLGGTLSNHVGNLSFLRYINLKFNNLQGTIPSEMGRLFRLRMLFLSYNSFSGEIPLILANYFSLQVIDLFGNQLSGKVPRQLGSLSKLKTLDLGSNLLTGSIPSSLGNLSSLIEILVVTT